MSGKNQTDKTKALDEQTVEADENREAIADGSDVQDFRSDRKPAESSTAFGDDAVTPHLNDGR